MAAFSFAVLRQRDFRLLLMTRLFIIMGLQSQAVIVGWQVYSLTRDPFMLGLIGFTEALPAITCALFAGHVVDISRPQRVYLICLGALALNTLLLWLLAGGILHAPAAYIVPGIFTGIFISGIARSFIMPSSFSLLPQIVTRPQIPAASAWLGSGFQLAAICGPAIAGLVYGGYGVKVAWLLPVTLMISAFVMLWSMSAVTRQYRSSERREPAMQSIRAGWRFIWQQRVLLSVMALDMFAVLFGGATAMLPAYADKVLHVGSEGLGLLRATVLLWVVCGFGVCMIGFGASTVFWLSMTMLAASGAFDSVSMVMRGTLMQLLIPDTMRGRVSAVNSMFIISSNEIGAFESGVAARFLGLVPSVILGGVATLMVVGATAFLSPKFRRTTVRTEDQAA